ncbi:MAG: EAL domain-containing protein, partial [Thiohalobacteraceae bacterium]
LSIDDFGTGLSSLSYLKRLPVNELKIDKSFVADMAEDENNAVLVRSIIDLSHNIGRLVVAEGVEDHEVLLLLEMLGCDAVQGFYISHPCDAADIEAWLESSPWGLRAKTPWPEPVSSQTAMQKT